jgi:hypothetical protein
VVCAVDSVLAPEGSVLQTVIREVKIVMVAETRLVVVELANLADSWV